MLEEVLEREPDSGAAHRLLGGFHYTGGDLPKAELHLKRANEILPGDPMPVLYLGMMAERQGAIQQATGYYEKVLQLSPDNAVALNNLAYILAETGTDLDRALTLIQKARGLAPKDPNIADTLAFVYIKKDLPDSALPILEPVVSSNPKTVIWRYHYALALYEKGLASRAKEQLETALGYQPTEEEQYKIRELLSKIGM